MSGWGEKGTKNTINIQFPQEIREMSGALLSGLEDGKQEGGREGGRDIRLLPEMLMPPTLNGSNF